MRIVGLKLELARVGLCPESDTATLYFIPVNVRQEIIPLTRINHITLSHCNPTNRT